MHEVQRPVPYIERYETPSSLSEALVLLSRHRERATLVAGATDLLPALARGAATGAKVWIDITRIPGLSGISRPVDSTLRLGLLVTHNQIVKSKLATTAALPLAQACLEIGSPQLRNRATIAGNLIAASATSDTLPPLYALDASVILSSVHAQRTVRLRDFYIGSGRTRIRPDEMISAIEVPAMTPQQCGMFVKLNARRGLTSAVANLAIVLSLNDDETVVSADIRAGKSRSNRHRQSSSSTLHRGQALNRRRHCPHE